MAGWSNIKDLLREEVTELKEAGFDVQNFLIPDTTDEVELEKAYDQLLASPVRLDYPYVEPDELEEILSSTDSIEKRPIEEEKLRKHLHAAWTGRAAGCALGKPVEGGPYMNPQNGIPCWKQVKKWFSGADAYPIADYTPGKSRAQEEGLRVNCPASQKENIQFMESDDDVRYTVLGLRLMEEKGMDFTEWDVGLNWHRNLPYHAVCTAETQAYLNFAKVYQHIDQRMPADYEKRLDYVRNYRNPYREWIGAQIRIDAYGYAAAGDPMTAARMAYRDAHFSHVKNGVYGAMFCAAMIADAFIADSPRKIVEDGLKVVPKKSRLYEAIADTLDWVKPSMDLEEVCDTLFTKWGNYNGVHTINNAACCAAMILWADGDFEKAITGAVLCGWDTDCNGATVGSIMGAYLGAIPEKWSAPLHDTMYASVVGFDPVTFTEGAERILKIYKKTYL